MWDIKEINEAVKKESVFVEQILSEVGKVIVGQRQILEGLVLGLLANGHILIEGVPGLAKTLAIKTLAGSIQAKFQRIQFTPDLLPADLTGTTIYNPRAAEGKEFTVRKGPIFSNFILADEINRAPAKVQSALLEAMQERQVTMGETTFKLEDLFLVLATQNPIEQEGTYPLPEAQVDRFMLKLKITYPQKEEELQILERMTTGSDPKVSPVVNPKDIVKAREVVNKVYIDEKVKKYIVDIVFATRSPQDYKMDDLKPLIAYGASPRATIYLTTVGKAYAFMRGRGYVTPEDIKTIAGDVLRHRIILTYEAEAEETTTDDIVKHVLNEVEVP
ncbi:ATPase [Candidatus Desantisbacteria bacterium CG_4_10_14_0_8_um_filter_48_22]|uniref:ATPase n=1 Tax=Candidatus Desantisbacteria bacterium CG_4_10_14_0_8_um_filter_48_22 TaxID=1974543 RepID=A0A2M7SBU1_9BACT|nr:MAG: ATPase [Candidatus Desantisbacteria bacterium CG1_02_49_89]PIV57116.1 MAG: ATPase [Candidatus Desantisbacteria bacterium CG02_land_8_20_14_3_00_49_13]PIZ17016.1 MAG: ATPase [Candidatus Desantisbacteria bacterium CG_4_10_14_0_8_um_filter_48_22]PJB27851.1 MAG: ATPase [Candidatus Desantisbacteria bacterium CG_4_9_14_3_um_filter_50_7]